MTAFTTELITAFGIGLLGSGHCLAMCGGIAGALSLRAASGQQIAAPAAVPLYSLGRIGSYALLGAVAGAVGAAAVQLIPHILGALRLIAGGLLILMGIYLAGLWNGLAALERAGGVLFRLVQPLQRRLHGPFEPLALGMVWGLLPCGLVYSTLAWSVTHADPIRGAALMAAFGAGTLPAVVAGGLAAVPLGRILRRPLVRRVGGALIVTFGLWTLAAAGGEGRHGQHQGHATQSVVGSYEAR